MKAIFGGVIAIILLGLYAYSVIVAILIVACEHSDGCASYNKDMFTSGFQTTISLVGGLVSALVIAELAVTPSGKAPSAKILANNYSKKVSTILKILTGLYLIIWLGLGLTSFIIGVMKYPDYLPDLTTLGRSWLGLAVASAYAYFGINPEKEHEINSGP
jgi:hypothetical protein